MDVDASVAMVTHGLTKYLLFQRGCDISHIIRLYRFYYLLGSGLGQIYEA